MDMSWQALLQEAAATSFEKTADTLAAAENDNCACIDLHQQQIHELSKKILLLPHQGRVLLLSRYGFRLIGSNKDNICFYGKNNETNFVLYNVTDLRFKNGDYKILYGQNNSFVRLRAEYA